MGITVTAIRVGGEWHATQSEDGDPLSILAVSEQCDHCGGPGHISLDSEGWACDTCGCRYSEGTVDDSRAVFYA